MNNTMYIWVSTWETIEANSIKEAIKIIKETPKAYEITFNGVSKSTDNFMLDLNFKG